MIIAGATAYSRIIDFAAFRAIADEVGALLLVDAAHIAGLIVGGAHPSPVPYADVVTFTTHKTLRGPRGGAIVCRREYGAAIDKAVFPGLQGGPLMHVIAAKAVAFHEAAQPDFAQYAADVVTNAAALAAALAEEGFRIVSGGTDNHLMLVDLRPFGVTGKVAQEALDRAGITCNKNAIPNDPEKPFVTSGLRLGSAVVHDRGHGSRRDARDRVADRPRCCARSTTTASRPRCASRPTASAPSSRRTRKRDLGLVNSSLRGRPRGRAGHHAARDAARAAARDALRRGGAAVRRPAARPQAGRRRRSAARRCSSASSSRWRSRRMLPEFHDMFQQNSEPFGLMLGAGVMFVVGALDDLIDVSPPAKVAGQVLAAGLLTLAGVTMFFFRMPFNLFHTDTVVLGSSWAPLVTVLWVVLMTNAINLIDGLDGLAAGIVAIGGGALFLFADRLSQAHALAPGNIGPLVAIIAVGVCLGFLPFNWNPSKIMMGDAGALFLGVLLAVPTITIGGRTDTRVLGQHVLLLRAAAHPGRDPRRPDPRHRVLVRPARRAPPALAPGRRRPPAPPAHAPRSRPAPHGRHPLGVDRAALGRRAAADVHERGQRARAVRRSRRSRCSCSRGSTPDSDSAGPVPSGRATRPRTRPTSSTSERRNRCEVVDLARAPPQTGVIRGVELAFSSSV